MAPLIQLTGVTKTIPRSSAMALRDATCVIDKGEFVSVIGTSGSGKTTLLSILGLLDHPSSGTYLFDGVDVGGLDEKARNRFRGHRIGFVFQNSYLIAEESAARNVGLGLRVRGVPTGEQRLMISSGLAQVGLESSAEKMAGDLSGGEKQRVAVARALVTRPEVILADEPTGALDSDSTAKLIGLLREINAQGTTVVVVTHDPLVAAAADRVIRIEDGVVEPSPPALREKGVIAPSGQALVMSPPAIQEMDPLRPSVVADLPMSPSPPVVADDAALSGHTGMSGDVRQVLGPAGSPVVDRGASNPPVTAGRRGIGRESRSSAFIQTVGDALSAPVTRLGRTALVVIAYVLGVAALVGAVGVMSGTTGQIVRRLTDAGSNQIRVVDSSPADDSWALLDTQARALERVEGVHDSIPLRTFTVVSNTITRVRGLGDKFTGRITMTDERFMAAYQMSVQTGAVDLLSNPWNGAVVVLGSGAAQTLWVADAEPGVSLWVNDRPVDVAAVLAPTGDTLLDNALYFSPGAIAVLLDPLDRIVEVHTLPGYAEPLAKAIPVALSPANPGQIQTSTVAQLAQLQQGINTDLSSLLTVIGWVVLVLSALTAGTTMFLSVQHRAAEIALRRAMGASRGAIFQLFTIEGIAIGVTGGILGTGLGIGLTILITHLNQWPLALGLGVVAQGLGVGFIAGAVASIIPAIYASRRDPAQILRTV